MDKVKYLTRINLFHDLNREQLQQLESVTPIDVLKKGTLIASPYREQKRLYLIKSGTVRLYKLSEEGKELTVDILGAGHIFGAIESFTTGAENQYAVALEDCVSGRHCE